MMFLTWTKEKLLNNQPSHIQYLCAMSYKAWQSLCIQAKTVATVCNCLHYYSEMELLIENSSAFKNDPYSCEEICEVRFDANSVGQSIIAFRFKLFNFQPGEIVVTFVSSEVKVSF